jgi:hypothetical protein
MGCSILAMCLTATVMGCTWQPATVNDRPDAVVRLIDASSDACSYAVDAAATGSMASCCQYLPDVGEATKCALAYQALACEAGGAAPNGPCYQVCGDLACEQSDCSVMEVPYCRGTVLQKIDAGVDAGVTDATVSDSL